MLGRKLRSWTFKTKESRAGLVQVPLFWKFHCSPCVSTGLNTSRLAYLWDILAKKEKNGIDNQNCKIYYN